MQLVLPVSIRWVRLSVVVGPVNDRLAVVVRAVAARVDLCPPAGSRVVGWRWVDQPPVVVAAAQREH